MRVFAVAAVLFNAVLSSDAPVRDQAIVIQTIRGLESQIKNASFALQTSHLGYNHKTDAPGERKEDFDSVDGTVAAGTQTSYRIDIKNHLLWEEKKSYTDQTHQYSFYRSGDAKEQGWIAKSIRMVNTSGVEEPYTGKVSADQHDNVLNSAFSYCRLSVIPTFYKGLGLANYLESLPEGPDGWKVVESSPARISLEFVLHPTDLSQSASALHHMAAMTLDLAHGGLISSYEERVWGDDTPDKVGIIERLKSIKYTQIDGVWLPAKVECVTLDLWETTFEWHSINVAPETLNLALDFPAGLNVHDEIAGIKYVASMGGVSQSLLIDQTVESMITASPQFPPDIGERLPASSEEAISQSLSPKGSSGAWNLTSFLLMSFFLCAISGVVLVVVKRAGTRQHGK